MEGRRVMLVARWLAGALLAAVAAIGCALLTGDLASADEPTTGSITIVLDASPDDGQDFTFTGCQGPWCGEFSLDDDADPTRANTTTAEVEPGTYTITQHAVANWTLSSLACDTGETVSLADRRATIDLSAGEDVTCTFTTTSASITIIQDSNPQDGHDFTYTGCLGAGCSTVALDDDLDPTLPDRVTAAGLAPGTYVVTHATDANWALTSISCTTGESVSLANRRVTITLIAGEQTTCTFKDRGASITVVQDTSPDDGQDFDYTGCLGTACAEFTVDDDADPTHTNTISARVLAPGTYTVTQAPGPPTLPLSALSCNTSEITSRSARRATIKLTAGEQVTCTFTNTHSTSPGVLTVSLDTQPDSAADVVIHRCGDAGCTEVVLDDDGRPDRADTTGPVSLPPGYYTLTVDPVDDHALYEISCGSTGNVDPDLRRATARLEAGGSDSCTVVIRAPRPPLEDVAEVSPGTNGTCARLTSGEARCWGDNMQGGLGDGTLEDSPVPVEVLQTDGSGPLTGVTSISSGFAHTCVALTDGQARCWGRGWQGELGNGTASVYENPLPVVVSNPAGTGALTDVVDIGAGDPFSCAMLTSGQARCWGGNSDGAIGDGTNIGRLRPVPVLDPTGTGPLTGIRQLAVGGFHACALLDSGEARCWGSNRYGRLGDGTTANRNRPTVVSNEAGTGPLAGIVALATGYGQTCALLDSGQGRCWGSNASGQLGDGSTHDSSRPIAIVNADGSGPLTGIVQLGRGGFNHMCARVETGEAYCWGDNGAGLVGDGTTADRLRPTAVVGPSGPTPLQGVTGIALGIRQTCALLESGQARCWGGNGDGLLGDGTTITHLRPVPVIDPHGADPWTDAIDVSAGVGHTCAAHSDGRAWCWGSNSTGQLGNPDLGMTDVPVPVLDAAGDGPLTGVAEIDAGGNHSCAAFADGTAACWGDQTPADAPLPVLVPDVDGVGPLTGVRHVDAGTERTCAIRDDASAVCWGIDGDPPVVVLDEAGSAPLGDMVDVSVGYDHTCAVLGSGQARCWGSEALGNGAGGSHALPQVVLDPTGAGPLTDVVAISAGDGSTCALVASGEARCWGYSPGDGSPSASLPVVVSNPAGTGPLIDIASVDLGADHSCATTTDGTAWCWGVWPVGDGTREYRARPVAVSGLYPGGPRLAGVTQVASGHRHSCATVTGGQIHCWGLNDSGQLGDGVALNVNWPSPSGHYSIFRLRPTVVVRRPT